MGSACRPHHSLYGRAGLDVASLSPRHILDATAGDVERLVYRHMEVLMAAVQFVALAKF